MPRILSVLIAIAAGVLLATGLVLGARAAQLPLPAWLPWLFAATVAALAASRAASPAQPVAAAEGATGAADVLNPVTGALSEARLVAVLLALMSIANRYQRPLSVATLQPNDGVRMGDLVDNAVESLRTTDRIGHHGDGVLLVVMPETELEQARRVIGRLRGELEAATPLRSVGVAGFNAGDDLQALLARAEEDAGQPATA